MSDRGTRLTGPLMLALCLSAFAVSALGYVAQSSERPASETMIVPAERPAPVTVELERPAPVRTASPAPAPTRRKGRRKR